jgi:hypothetical protein
MSNTENTKQLERKLKLKKIKEYFSNRSINDYAENEKKDIEGYEGLYMATIDGGVWSCRSKKFLSPSDNTWGYLYIGLCKNGKQKNCRVNRLIALTFISNPDPEKLLFVGHKDGDSYNNHVDNLYWTDSSENNTHDGKHLEIRKKLGKLVRCLDDGEIYESLSQAERETGISAVSIGRVCNGRQKTAGGKHWEFVDPKQKTHAGRKRLVRCLDDGEIYESMAAAGRAVGVTTEAIRLCCNGKTKTAGGCHFEFVEEVLNR